MQKNKKYLLIQILLAFTINVASSQSIDKVVILSQRVGDTIDVAERNYYNIFQTVKNFKYAIIYVTPDNNFYARFTLSTKDGTEKDTVILYNQRLLLNIAEKIEYYEALKAGRYKMGDLKVTLQSEGIILPFHEKVKDYKSKYPSDLLPCADEPKPKEMKFFPNFKFGFGFCINSLNLRTLGDAFRKIEDYYRAQGYYISDISKDIQSNSAFYFSIDLQIFPNYVFLIDGMKSVVPEKLDYQSSSVSLLYDFDIFPESSFNTYFGLGLGTYYFFVKRNYGARISPISPSGSYEVLDYIGSSGARIGFSIISLLNYDLPLPDYISVVIKYSYVPSMETTILDTYITSVNLSSFNIGVRLTIPID